MFARLGHWRNSSSTNASRVGRCLGIAALTLLIAAPFANAGLFSTKPSKLLVYPPTIELRGAGDEHRVLVTAVIVDGTQLDVTDSARFLSKQPKIVSVSTNGVCRPIGDGSTQIVVQYGGRTEN